ncbi:hypothetical protein JOD62_001246 [Microbacterium keratanolyticum]|nr:hypothetical protein [Microbacterium keratanolyticum]
MLVGILIGIAIVCVGIVGILVRRPFYRLIIRGIKRLYGQPLADMYAHVGVKGVVIGGVGIIAFGVFRIIVAILTDS